MVTVKHVGLLSAMREDGADLPVDGAVLEASTPDDVARLGLLLGKRVDVLDAEGQDPFCVWCGHRTARVPEDTLDERVSEHLNVNLILSIVIVDVAATMPAPSMWSEGLDFVECDFAFTPMGCASAVEPSLDTEFADTVLAFSQVKPESVAEAEALGAAFDWIRRLHEHVNGVQGTWDTPNVATSPRHETVLEWWRGHKKVTLYISSSKEVEYVRVWGPDVDLEMDDGRVADIMALAAIWSWLGDATADPGALSALAKRTL
jgi:hypothetical protein